MKKAGRPPNRPKVGDIAKQLFIGAVSNNPQGSQLDPDRFACHSFRLAKSWVEAWDSWQINEEVTGEELLKVVRKNR